MPPPHDHYDPRSKRFVTAGGRVRTRAEMRKEVDKLTDHIKKESKALAEKFGAGKLTSDQFEAEMRSLLKSGHIVASSVGRGGRARMTAKDWGRVGAKIKWQYKYLKRFARLIRNDILSGPASSNRVQLYAASILVSYYRSVYAEQKDRPGDVPKDANGKEIMVKLVQNSQEGCEDCIADAGEGWMPLDEMGELGTRACGDFCKCDLVFSDDELNEYDLTETK